MAILVQKQYRNRSYSNYSTMGTNQITSGQIRGPENAPVNTSSPGEVLDLAGIIYIELTLIDNDLGLSEKSGR